MNSSCCWRYRDSDPEDRIGLSTPTAYTRSVRESLTVTVSIVLELNTSSGVTDMAFVKQLLHFAGRTSSTACNLPD